MKKVPWGIVAGVCAIVVFFAVIGTIASYLILNGIASTTNETASIFGKWYQVLLFVVDIIFGLGLIGSGAMYFVTAKEKGKGETA